jgi:transposase
MAANPSKIRGINPQEVEEALAVEQCPEIRKRLQAVKLVLLGNTHAHAAKQVHRGENYVSRWVSRARLLGCSAVTLKKRAGRPSRTAREQVKKARAQIKAALDRNTHVHLRKRLLAMDALLTGASVEQVAAELHVNSDRIGEWQRCFRKNGLAALMGAKEVNLPRDTWNIDAKLFREMSAKEADKLVATRLLTLANIADGMGVIDAAARTKFSDATVRNWLLRFQKGGIEALRYKHKHRMPMLNVAQINALKEIVLAQPKLSFAELATMVQIRFGASYTPSGINRLLKESFGLVRRRGRFEFATPPIKVTVSGLHPRFRALVDVSAPGIPHGSFAPSPQQ